MEDRGTTGSTPGTKSRLQSIDALRGMAAIAVVVHHAFTQGSNPASAPWFSVLRAVTEKYVLGFTGPLLRTISASAVVLWVQWYLGAVAVEAYFGVIRLPRFFTRMSSAALFAVVALVSGEYVEMMAPLLWGLTFFCLVNAVVKREGRGDWPKRRMRFWAFSGEISYSLYLVHLPAMFVMGWVVRRFVSTNDPVLYTLVALLLAGASYVVAWLFFLLVERHFIAPRQRPVARLRAMEAA